MIWKIVYLLWWFISWPIEVIGYGCEWVEEQLYRLAYGDDK